MANVLINLYLKCVFKKIRKGTKAKYNMKEQYNCLMIQNCLMFANNTKNNRKKIFSDIFRAKK